VRNLLVVLAPKVEKPRHFKNALSEVEIDFAAMLLHDFNSFIEHVTFSVKLDSGIVLQSFLICLCSAPVVFEEVTAIPSLLKALSCVMEIDARFLDSSPSGTL
jgi:hypothetical protein